MSNLEERLNIVEAQLSIQQTITRYCRALDWLDEDLLRRCYTADAYVDYGFYAGNVEGFIPVVMEIERQALHRWHFLSNIASEIHGDHAEVECYGMATSTYDGKALNIFAGRYLMRCEQSPSGWLMSHNQYVLDYNFTAQVTDLGDAMGQLQSGVGLAHDHRLYRKLDRPSS
jgi:hypothetical protein